MTGLLVCNLPEVKEVLYFLAVCQRVSYPPGNELWPDGASGLVPVGAEEKGSLPSRSIW